LKVLVQRSALRMWLLAIGGLPLLVIAVDVLTNRRITNWLREMIFTPSDTQIYEPRDVIWAWALLIFSVFLVLWGLKELFMPTKVIEALDAGMAVRLRGPLGSRDVIPWASIGDIEPGEMMDEGQLLPLLEITVFDRAGLPEHPWGARWIETDTLGMLTQDWSSSPTQVAEDLATYAVEAAHREAVARTTHLWEPSS
jgi:hypothetical protein